jgi:hypothetical protein
MLKGIRNSAIVIALVIAPAFVSNSYRANLEHFRNRAEYVLGQLGIAHPNELFHFAALRLQQAPNSR